MLDGVYRRTEGEPAFQAARRTRAELEGLLDKNIVRFMKMLRRFHLLDVGGLHRPTVPHARLRSVIVDCSRQAVWPNASPRKSRLHLFEYSLTVDSKFAFS